MQDVTLTEHRPLVLGNWYPCAADQRLLQGLSTAGRLEFEELRQGTRLRAKSWVGTIQLSDRRIVVEPKIEGALLGLLQMLEFGGGYDHLWRATSRRSIKVDDTRALVELIVELFIDDVERLLRRGLRSDYVEVTEALPYLRGRLLAREQVLKRYGVLDQIWCRYDDRTTDIADNQLIAAGLRIALRLARGTATLRRCRRAALQLEEQAPTAVSGLHDRQWTYDRLNEPYRSAHDLARLLLRNLSLDDPLATGRTDCFAFLFDMNSLFERCIERLAEAALGDGVRVRRQTTDRSVVTRADSRPYLRLRPDLVLEWPDGSETVADAKYKVIDGTAGREDVAQVLLYANARMGTGARAHGCIVHPATKARVTTDEIVCHTGVDRRTRTTMTVIGLPVIEYIAAAERGDVEALGPLAAAMGADPTTRPIQALRRTA